MPGKPFWPPGLDVDAGWTRRLDGSVRVLVSDANLTSEVAVFSRLKLVFLHVIRAEKNRQQFVVRHVLHDGAYDPACLLEELLSVPVIDQGEQPTLDVIV